MGAGRLDFATLIFVFFSLVFFAGCVSINQPESSGNPMSSVSSLPSQNNISANETASQSPNLPSSSEQNNSNSQTNETGAGVPQGGNPDLWEGNSTSQNTFANSSVSQTQNATAGQNDLENKGVLAEPQVVEEAKQKITGSASIDLSGGKTRSRQCAITMNKYQVPSGKEVELNVYAYSPSNERVSYICGDEVVTAGFGGLMDFIHICQFDEPGLADVWVALDGQICASAPLFVYTEVSQSNRFCKVLAGTGGVSENGISKTYWTSVYLRNYMGGDNISWSCSGEEFSYNLGELLQGNVVSGVLNITCDYALGPEKDVAIEVYAINDYCGKFGG